MDVIKINYFYWFYIFYVRDICPSYACHTNGNFLNDEQSHTILEPMQSSYLKVGSVACRGFNSKPPDARRTIRGFLCCKGGDLHNERYLTICRKLGDCDVDHLWHLSWLFREYFRKIPRGFPCVIDVNYDLSLLKYFDPWSQPKVTTTVSGPRSEAIAKAAETFKPVEGPQRIPSSVASLRHI